jgi:phosphate transport system substrate-binding protein
VIAITAAALSVVSFVALAGCGGGGSAGGDGKLVVTGSSTVAPLAAEIGKRFESLHSGVRIDVQSGGSSRGIADARSGLADIGMVSRALNDDESDLRAFQIARDGVCVIVNAANAVTTLSDEQIVGIYTGAIVDWGEAGGKSAPITVVNKAEGRSTLELFLGYFGLESREIKASVVIGDNEQGIKTVAGNPDAIGYVSVGAAEYSVKSGVAVKLLPMAGVAPTSENVRNGSFPLSRELNLVTKGAPQDLALDFIEYARSAEVHDLIQALYFVPLE